MSATNLELRLHSHNFRLTFFKRKSFLIFLWRGIQTLWKMFCSTMDFRVRIKKQKSENVPGRDLKYLPYVIQMVTIWVFPWIIWKLNISIHIHTFLYTYPYLHIPTCAYFQTSYFKSSLGTPSLCLWAKPCESRRAAPLPWPRGSLWFCGKTPAGLPRCGGQRWERNLHLGISLSWSQNN